MESTPWEIVGPLLALALLIDAIALVDLRRVAAVDKAPRWAWALIILVSFPMGVILYATIGRRPDGGPLPEPQVRAPAPPPPPTSRPASADGPPVVTTRGLTRRFGETVAVDDVDLVVPQGATYGLIGPNGAGKTTLLSLLTGLRRPSSGELHLGVPHERIAVLPDTPSFDAWLTAREVVDLARNLQAPDAPTTRVDDVLREVGLHEVADRRVGGFSRGMLQRLGLATCLVTDPALLLLDEPSSALDPAGRREVLDLIGRLAGERTVLLSTHILSDVQRVCDTVGVLDRGRLRYQGPIADLLQRTAAATHVTVRPPADDIVTALERSPIVSHVEVPAPGHLVVHLHDAEQAERELPRLLADAGARVLSLGPATDLETAFLELTS